MTAAGALLAISIAGGRLDTAVGGAHPASPSPLSGSSVTAAQLRSHLLKAIQSTDLHLEYVIEGAVAEADAAALLQEKREQSNRIERERRMAAAYVLNDRDADKEMRYRTRYEREFDATLRQLETLQRARNGADIPPIRVQVEDPRE